MPASVMRTFFPLTRWIRKGAKGSRSSSARTSSTSWSTLSFFPSCSPQASGALECPLSNGDGNALQHWATHFTVVGHGSSL